MKEGSIVMGKITAIKDYGAFVKVDDYDGLIHISELSDDFVRSIESIVNVGDLVKLKVISVEEEQSRLKLSYKSVNSPINKLKKYNEFQLGFSSIKKSLPNWIEVGSSVLGQYEKTERKK